MRTLFILAAIAVVAGALSPDGPDATSLAIAPWLIPVGISLGGKIAGSLFGKKKKPQEAAAEAQAAAYADPRRAAASEAAFTKLTDAETARGSKFSDAYESGIMGFDPRSYMRDSAGALFEQFGETANAAEQGRRVDLQRRGWGPGAALGSGRQMRDLNSRLSRELAGLSMQTAGMEMDRLGSIGGYGERARDRSLDATFGRYATDRESMELARRAKQEEGASKRNMWGQIGGALIGAAGTAAGAYLGRR